MYFKKKRYKKTLFGLSNINKNLMPIKDITMGIFRHMNLQKTVIS